jgi:hypothetical protein
MRPRALADFCTRSTGSHFRSQGACRKTGPKSSLGRSTLCNFLLEVHLETRKGTPLAADAFEVLAEARQANHVEGEARHEWTHICLGRSRACQVEQDFRESSGEGQKERAEAIGAISTKDRTQYPLLLAVDVTLRGEKTVADNESQFTTAVVRLGVFIRVLGHDVAKGALVADDQSGAAPSTSHAYDGTVLLAPLDANLQGTAILDKLAPVAEEGMLPRWARDAAPVIEVEPIKIQPFQDVGGKRNAEDNPGVRGACIKTEHRIRGRACPRLISRQCREFRETDEIHRGDRRIRPNAVSSAEGSCTVSVAGAKMQGSDAAAHGARWH